MLNPTINAPQACAKSTSDSEIGPTPPWTIFTKTYKKGNFHNFETEVSLGSMKNEDEH